jgi:predicted PolB exonuclease-like 3'-5' exonuclease
LDGKIKEIRDYCETDVVNTYLVYCRFQRMRGGVSPEEYEEEIQFVKNELLKESKTANGAFWQEYLNNFSVDSKDSL